MNTNRRSWIVVAAGALVLCGAIYYGLKHRSAAGELIRMARSGASETELLNAVDKSGGDRVSAGQIVALKEANVSDRVIIALLYKGKGPGVRGQGPERQ